MKEISEQEARLHYFTTSNINLTAFLCKNGFNYVEAKRYNKSVMFYFEKSSDLEDCVNDFFANKDLRGYLEYVRAIRSELKLID